MAEPACDVQDLTRRYEHWLTGQIPIVQADLEAKHHEMSTSPVRFLRGTYYLWLRRVVELVPDLLAHPEVPLIGDLHIENYGTWRDRKGALRSGVNDFDELGWGSYRLDLVRLATSAVLAPAVGLSRKKLCEVLLDEWQSAAPHAAARMDDPASRHLRSLMPPLMASKKYFATLERGERVTADAIPAPIRNAVKRTVSQDWSPSWHVRLAGTGSLGHPRYDAVGVAKQKPVAREVKLLGPATAEWVHSVETGDQAALVPQSDELLYGHVMAAIQGPADTRRLHGWQIRVLAPDVVRIELAGLRAKDAECVIRSMARATVNVHGSDPARLAAARADCAQARAGWMRDAVEVMAKDTMACFEQWSGRKVEGIGG